MTDAPVQERAITPAMLRVMCDELRALGYDVERPQTIDVTVENLEQVSPMEFRADVEVLISRVGRVTVRRVYMQKVEYGWQIKWPRRHKEGTPFERNQEWVITTAMSGRLADAVKEALVAAHQASEA